MMHDPIRTCATCAWWSNAVPVLATGIRRATGSERDIGTCHAAVPVVVRLAGTVTSQFPETHATRRCGRWTAKIGGGPGGGESIDDTVTPFRRQAA